MTSSASLLSSHNMFCSVSFGSGYIDQQQFYINAMMQTKTNSSCEYKLCKSMTQITVNELSLPREHWPVWSACLPKTVKRDLWDKTGV